MPSYTTPDGLNIAYRVLGEGEPVVLVHGWMVGGAIFDSIADSLIGAGKQLIIPDQRGVGDSAQPPTGYTLEMYARDLIELVNVAGLKQFKLVGHSMGGQIAQLVATTLGTRIETMVLMCPVPAAGVPLPDEVRRMFRSSAGNVETQTAILNMACKKLDEAGLATILATAATVFPNCIAESFDAWTAGGFEARLKDITCKKTYVIGTDDPFLPREVLEPLVVQLIANAEFVYMPGAGHYPQIEATAATAAKLIELLA
jgi:pimeloyl-ACP methyl ester carboxylesterase